MSVVDTSGSWGIGWTINDMAPIEGSKVYSYPVNGLVASNLLVPATPELNNATVNCVLIYQVHPVVLYWISQPALFTVFGKL